MGCTSCGRQTTLVFAADGQPVDFDAAFPPHRLLMWMAAARRAMASGMPGVAVGSCTACGMPLVISSKQPVKLPCPHCKNVVEGPAEQLLVDQWVEPWAKIETGGLSLEYRLAWVDDSTAITAGCAGCGAPTPADDPAMKCARCQSTTWVERETGGEEPKKQRMPSSRLEALGGAQPADASRVRMQLGVRVNGMRMDRPNNVILSIPQGEATLRADNVTGSSASSSSSLLGVTGIGCAIAVAGFILLILLIVIIAHFSK